MYIDHLGSLVPSGAIISLHYQPREQPWIYRATYKPPTSFTELSAVGETPDVAIERLARRIKRHRDYRGKP